MSWPRHNGDFALLRVYTGPGGVPAETYSIGFAAQGYDEMEYARIASRHFGTHHHEYYVTPDDVVAAIPEVAAVCDQPFGNASAVPASMRCRGARSARPVARLSRTSRHSCT